MNYRAKEVFQHVLNYWLFLRFRIRIKYVLWEYSCDEEYLEEFNKGKIIKYFLLLAVLPQNRLDPSNLT